MTLIHALFWFTGLVIWAILWMIFVAWIAVGLPEIIRERMEHRRLRKDGRSKMLLGGQALTYIDS